MTGRGTSHDHDLADGCGPSCPPLPGRGMSPGGRGVGHAPGCTEPGDHHICQPVAGRGPSCVGDSMCPTCFPPDEGRTPSSEPVRHMAPGYVGSCCWDSDGGAFVVLQSNRGGAKHWLSEDQGLVALADWYGVDPAVLAGRTSRQEWRTVLARECDDGYHDVGCGVDDCEQGNYCSQGTGARWVDVLGVSNHAVTTPARGSSSEDPR